MPDAIKNIASCVLAIVFASLFFYRSGKYKAIRLLINHLLTSRDCPLCMAKYGGNVVEWLKPGIEQRVKQVVFGELED